MSVGASHYNAQGSSAIVEDLLDRLYDSVPLG